MSGVTQGLATAFDTTFVGLVFVALLLLPTEALKRLEYGMLDRIESFTNDVLLRRLADAEDKIAHFKSAHLSPELAQALEPPSFGGRAATFQPHRPADLMCGRFESIRREAT